jgi:hypothetical protein
MRLSAGTALRGGRERGSDVGVTEVVALEQQRFSGGLSQGVREAVPEVQAGLVAAALAEIAIRLAGEGFNTTDVPLEFCLLPSEVAEAFDSWQGASGCRGGTRGRGYLPVQGRADDGRRPGRGDRGQDRQEYRP